MAKSADTKSGSIAYNRLDMQISQVLHLAIEVYDNLDFLLVLDHYDDITLFDDASSTDTVSYYQMKTNDLSFTMATIIKEDWIGKLYSHLGQTDAFIRELGVITNCPIRLENKQLISAEKTFFSDFDQATIDKIKNDIANKFKIAVRDVDLSKFAHIRTTLSIDRHKDILEKETGDFLLKKYPDIKYETIKTIFSSVIEILTKAQTYERLPKNATIEEVSAKKGFSKQTFNKIISTAIKISIPSFEDIKRYISNAHDENEIAVAYAHILGDNSELSSSYITMFDELERLIDGNEREENETIWDYSEKCKKIYKSNNPSSMYLTDKAYINVLIACILMNK